MNRLRLATLALIYGAYLGIATLYPYELSREAPNSLAAALANSFKLFGAADFIANVLLFLPFGVLLYWGCSPARRRATVVVFAAIAGVVVSLFIEVLQVWFSRQPSGFDVLSNGLGAATGAALAAVCPARISAFAHGCWQKIERTGVVLGFAVLLSVVPAIGAIAQVWDPFGIWNSGFGFQIGNEASHNRPWLGQVHLVAVYSRALSSEEVAGSYHRGLSADGESFNPGVVALYAFNERRGNIVRDMSAVEPPLDLNFAQDGRVRWLESMQGIDIVKPAILKSRTPPDKLSRALRASRELSIEAWMTPDNITQGGPARIVSYSRDTDARNFTLGQEGAKISFRIRTPVSGPNGVPLVLKSGDDIQPRQRAQVVATYENGVGKLYINGRQRGDALDWPRDGIIGLATKRTLATRLAYSFIYFFPAGLFLALVVSNRLAAQSFLFAGIVATSLVALGEYFQAFAFKRPVDTSLLIGGTLIAVLGVLSGQLLAARHPSDNSEGLTRS